MIKLNRCRINCRMPGVLVIELLFALFSSFWSFMVCFYFPFVNWPAHSSFVWWCFFGNFIIIIVVYCLFYNRKRFKNEMKRYFCARMKYDAKIGTLNICWILKCVEIYYLNHFCFWLSHIFLILFSVQTSLSTFTGF